MFEQSPRFSAVFCLGTSDGKAADDFMVLRKRRFIDELGWSLREHDGREIDQFDRSDAVFAVLYADNLCVGGWRAIRCDRPYLGRTVFPALAVCENYPNRSECWEISRLCAARVPGSSVNVPQLVYGLMLRFALDNEVKSLVAVTDLIHERLLKQIGIRTKRYGPSQIVDLDHQGRPIRAVAGEIPMEIQNAISVERLTAATRQMELSDEALIFGSQRLSA